VGWAVERDDEAVEQWVNGLAPEQRGRDGEEGDLGATRADFHTRPGSYNTESLIEHRPLSLTDPHPDIERVFNFG
jgi:hypothetical protein